MRDPEDPRSDEDMRAAAQDDLAWRAERPPESAHLTGGWRAQPPTEKQIRCLKYAGLVVPATKGEASDAIEALVARRKKRLPQRHRDESRPFGFDADDPDDYWVVHADVGDR